MVRESQKTPDDKLPVVNSDRPSVIGLTEYTRAAGSQAICDGF